MNERMATECPNCGGQSGVFFTGTEYGLWRMDWDGGNRERDDIVKITFAKTGVCIDCTCRTKIDVPGLIVDRTKAEVTP